MHFGNAPEDPERVGRMLAACPNYYVDTAARVPEIGRRAAATRRTILAHPDRAAVMEKGRIVMAGASDTLAAETAALAQYLGV